MIKIGNAESIVQLSIALNLAYFAFSEMRAPTLKHYGNLIQSVRKGIIDLRSRLSIIHKPEELKPADEATSLFIKREVLESCIDMHDHNLGSGDNPFSENMYSFDNGLRAVAIAMAIIGLGILYFSALNPQNQITVLWFTALIFVLLLPSIASVFYNSMILRLLRDDMNRILSIKDKINDIEKEFNDNLRPRHKKLLKDRQDMNFE